MKNLTDILNTLAVDKNTAITLNTLAVEFLHIVNNATNLDDARENVNALVCEIQTETAFHAGMTVEELDEYVSN